MANCIDVFEIPVVNLERAVRFYDEVLDTKLVVNQAERIAVIPYEKGEVVGVLVEWKTDNRRNPESSSV